MTAYVICSACGARIKADRDRCLRCDAPLVAAPPPSPARVKDRALVAGTVVSLFLLFGLAIVWEARTRPKIDGVAHPGGRPAPVAAAPAPTPAATDGDGAAEPFTPVTSLDSGRLAAAAYGQGDYDRARTQLEDAIRKQPDDVDALNNLGQILARQRRTDEAIQLFTRAATLAPDKWAAHFNLAHAFGEQGKWDAAIGEYRIAARLFPDDYATAFNLAMALHKKGEEDAAIAGYARAIQLAPGEASFHLALAISLEKLGRSAEARDEYARYVEMSPDAPDAVSIKARIAALAAAAPGAKPQTP